MEQARASGVSARGWRGALAAVGATVVAVVATLAIPSWLAASPDVSGVPRPPVPTRAPEGPGVRTWQQLRCASVGPDTCAAPAQIDHAGVVLHTVNKGGQLYAGSGADSTLTVTMRSPGRNRWVLVGAEGAGTGSRLNVTLGAAPGVFVPPGRLTLFSLPRHGRLVVTVTELGTPGEDEVLRIQEYASS